MSSFMLLPLVLLSVVVSFTLPYIRSSYVSVPCSTYSVKCVFNRGGLNTRYRDDNIYVTDKYGQTRVVSNTQALSSVINPCSSACGQNAQCSAINGRPVCSCLRGYSGNPLNYCRRAECLDEGECNHHQICKNERCVDSCEGACGLYAKCQVRNHLEVCTCPVGFTGNPLESCRRFDPQELCHPNPCGPNTLCEAGNQVLTCKCLPGYIRSNDGCQHECESDSECGPQMACVNFKCENPCLNCGLNAECHKVINHLPVCRCVEGYVGNPYVSCKPECTANQECPPNKPACYRNSCVNPCDKQICGYTDQCEIRRSASDDLTVECVKRNLCEPNPCGLNTECRSGHDRSNEPRPVCTCLPGYIGNPLTGCVKAECIEDDHCTNDKACIDHRCQNPCNTVQCGNNANCDAIRHCAICTCPIGYGGNPLVNCYPDLCDSTTCLIQQAGKPIIKDGFN